MLTHNGHRAPAHPSSSFLLHGARITSALLYALLYHQMTGTPKNHQDEKEKETGKFVRQERYAGSMSRSFYIGENVKEDDIHAK